MPSKLDKEQIALTGISAVKLSPGDILVVHAKSMSDRQKMLLDHELQKHFWGKPNTFMILSGDIKISTISPTQHAPTSGQ